MHSGRAFALEVRWMCVHDFITAHSSNYNRIESKKETLNLPYNVLSVKTVNIFLRFLCIDNTINAVIIYKQIKHSYKQILKNYFTDLISFPFVQFCLSFVPNN